jgi:riboflavin kinase / FMN adenylyltransferase
VERFRDAESLPRRLRSPAVALGNFDGVHAGHRRLLELCVEHARARGAQSVALTFDPHPARVLAPHLAPPLITGPERKAELLAASGIDVLVTQPFDTRFARRGAEEFARDLLAGALSAVEIVVGWDFTFGRDRAGDARALHEMGARYGFSTIVVPPVAVEGLVVSSTKIREFVLEGRLAAAALLLGRPFEVSGPVVPGRGRGRTIGVPTANLDPEGELLPPGGVYAAWAEVRGARHAAVVNIGTAPTFADRTSPVVEAHLIGFSGDLYDARIVLSLDQRLRAEQRFATPEALVRQIRSDIARAGELLR